MGENQKDNDLFFVCSLVEYIARKTKNKKELIVQKIGKEKLQKIYELADVYHSEDINKVSDEIIEKFGIKNGTYDVIENTDKENNIPTYWDIGKVYQRIIIGISDSENDYINKMMEVLSSWIIEKIDNYNSSMYYENTSYILACYHEGRVL